MSVWSQFVSGKWEGVNMVFTGDRGVYCGHMRTARSVKTAERMDVKMECVFTTDPLSTLFLSQPNVHSDVGCDVSDTSRLYLGPDIFGSGTPFGSLCIGTSYVVPWRAVGNFSVHIEGDLQVYSITYSRGGTPLAVINALFIRSDDENVVADFLEREIKYKTMARYNFYPSADSVRFSGSLKKFDARQSGRECVDSSSADKFFEMSITKSGRIAQNVVLRVDGGEYHYTRMLTDIDVVYDGRDICGNGRVFGRQLLSTMIVINQPLRFEINEYCVDDDHIMVIVRVFRSNAFHSLLYGSVRKRIQPGAKL